MANLIGMIKTMYGDDTISVYRAENGALIFYMPGGHMVTISGPELTMLKNIIQTVEDNDEGLCE